jgi:outer membrane protein assembly factor BamB
MFEPSERYQPSLFIACLLLSGIASAAPSITLSKTSGPPTSKILVSGRGFEANVGLDIFFDTRDEALTVTNAKGEFRDAGIHALRNARPGEHWVTALERNNDKGAQAPFLVQTNWTQFQFDVDHSSVNPFENVLSQKNVARLTADWVYGSGEGLVFSTPTVADGVAYITAIGLYAVDTKTGKLLWSFESGSQTFFCSPAVFEGALYVASPDGYFYALNAKTGAVLWKYPGTSYNGDTAPAVADGKVYYGGDRVIYALNAKTGALVWSYPTGSYTRSAPAVANGIVYAGSNDGYLYALDAHKGTLDWRAAIQVNNSAPAVAEGAVFVGGYNGTFYALDASSGTVLWNFPTTQTIESSPLVSNGLVYLLSDESNLYALNGGTGAQVWKYALGGQSANILSLALANQVLYLGYNSLYAFDPPTGKLLWNSPPLGLGSPAIANGVAYTSSFGGVSAFSVKAGNAKVGKRSQPPKFRTLHPNL